MIETQSFPQNGKRAQKAQRHCESKDQWGLGKGRQDLQEGIVNAFQVLLPNPRDWRAKLEGMDFAKLDEVDVARLELPFTKEEVEIALREMNGEKAPSLDGYTTNFG